MNTTYEESGSGYEVNATVEIHQDCSNCEIVGVVFMAQPLMVEFMNGITFLRVKLRSLAAESKIIRHQEKKYKWNNDLREQLYFHRVFHVRRESRATHIAYGFIRGKAYSEIECNPSYMSSVETVTIWSRVEAMVKKYGIPGAWMDIEKWRHVEVSKAA